MSGSRVGFSRHSGLRAGIQWWGRSSSIATRCCTKPGPNSGVVPGSPKAGRCRQVPGPPLSPNSQQSAPDTVRVAAPSTARLSWGVTGSSAGPPGVSSTDDRGSGWVPVGFADFKSVGPGPSVGVVGSTPSRSRHETAIIRYGYPRSGRARIPFSIPFSRKHLDAVRILTWTPRAIRRAVRPVPARRLPQRGPDRHPSRPNAPAQPPLRHVPGHLRIRCQRRRSERH